MALTYKQTMAQLQEERDYFRGQYQAKLASEAALLDKLAEQARAAEQDEREQEQLIKERDDMEERLTILAESVGHYFDVPVGEWSNCNSPDQVALAILNGEYKTKFDEQPAQPPAGDVLDAMAAMPTNEEWCEATTEHDARSDSDGKRFASAHGVHQMLVNRRNRLAKPAERVTVRIPENEWPSKFLNVFLDGVDQGVQFLEKRDAERYAAGLCEELKAGKQ